LGLLYFQQQNYPEAAKHLAKAADLGMNEARLYNFLGISCDRTGHLSNAVKSYIQAIQLDDKLAEAHLNLGFTYERLSRKTLAAEQYRQACKLNQDFCDLVKSKIKMKERAN